VQDLSFDFKRPVFEFGGLRFGVQVFTFENVYGLDLANCAVTGDERERAIRCNSLTWAGGQERVPGWVSVRAVKGEGKTTFHVQAQLDRTIRCTKLFLKGLPDGEIVNLRETESLAIPPQGLILRYPDGWRGLYTPLVVLRTEGGSFLYVRSLAPGVRETRFAFCRSEDGLEVELIYEELATDMGSRVAVPAWEVGRAESLEEVMEEQRAWLGRTYHLVPWETRPDVPGWAREVALVAAIHLQHWTGYVFNDYAKTLSTIAWLAERMDPKRLLVYLPGWEGRYYWQYGDYRPDPRMGGEEGFERLIREAKAMGAHVMPMFGINHANRGLPNFEQWGAPAAMLSAGGSSGGGSVDWDGSRHYDHGWGGSLNPGAPTWQNRLVSQISALVERYGFDGVFLDISAVWANDPRYRVYEGVLELVGRLKARHPELLVAGEGWYDGLGVATPLVQTGHTDGVLHWHDAPHPALFDTYGRAFGHLCLGDPGRGSTGVHELGYNPHTRTPLRRGVLPTVTLVDDTLQKAPEKVEAILADARTYAATFLTGTAVHG